MGNAKSKSSPSDTLTEEDIEYLLNNTRFNRNEIENWHKQFIVCSYLINIYLYLIFGN
jgi:hypothetical protein